jgi:hypothetical protein
MSISAAPGEDPDAWLDALRRADWSGAAVLKEESGDWVCRLDLDVGGRRRTVVAKRRAVRGPWNALKILLRLGRFDRHRRGALWLLAHGFLTARPLLHLRRAGLAAAEELLVLEFVPGETLLEAMARRGTGVRLEHSIARRVGRQVARLGAAGRYNRDHKPSNLLLVGGAGPQSNGDGADGAPEVAILDCVAIRRARRGVPAMFASLAIEPLGTGCLPRRALCMRAIDAWARDAVGGGEGGGSAAAARRRAMARACWRAARRLVAAHGDPRPRSDPLRRAPPR